MTAPASSTFRKRLLTGISMAGLLFFTAVFAKQATAPTNYAELKPVAAMSRATRDVVDALGENHYRQIKLDSRLSSTVFDRYLKDLDGQRLYFLASDLRDFEPYRFSFDEALRSGDLRGAFLIYNRYQRRVAERLNFVVRELEKGLKSFDYEREEWVETKRDDAPYASTAQELDALWQKRVKAAALNLRLAGKKDEEIERTLLKRYRSQLSHLYQTRPEDAFQVFMNAFTETYDPHTEYFSPRASENFNINMSLSLEGIGAVLQSEDEHTKVVRLVPGGPADKSRQLKPGDRIIGVGQGQDEFVDVVGWRIDEVVDLIRGPKGSEVRLQVLPANAPADSPPRAVSIVRNTVALEDQAAKKRVLTLTDENKQPAKVGVIELPSFYADFQGAQDGKRDYRSTTRDVRRLLMELKNEKIDGLVLDLRNNGGGSLQEANSLVGLFITSGPTVQIRDAIGRTLVDEDADPRVVYDGPMVVLVNRLSASAAEIFAGAIQDYRRGLVVGSTTFGKGTVQGLRPLSFGQIKITEAKFYRISGASNQHKGVEPDIRFPSLIDEKEIGESALPNALPWDTIAAVRYRPYFTDLATQLPALRDQHQNRSKQDPDFRFVEEQIALLDEMQARTKLSIKESTRRTEQKQLNDRRLAMENRRRKAKGQDPLESWQEQDDEAEAAKEPDESKPEDDAYLNEAGHILVDWLQLMPRTAQDSKKSPLSMRQPSLTARQ